MKLTLSLTQELKLINLRIYLYIKEILGINRTALPYKKMN